MLALTAPLRSVENSTNVRATISLAAAAAPGLVASWAIRRFCTPPRQAPAGWAPELRATARVRMMDAGAHDVRVRIWGEGPAILLVHGWGGRGAQLAAFVPPLVAAGHTVVAFDGPAHGDSPGRQATLLDFRDAVRTVADAAGPVSGLVAHSLGATAAAVALREGLAVGRVVFLAPPADPAPFFRRFLGALGVAPGLAPGIEAAFERRTNFRWRDLVVPAFAPALEVPLLVVHDRGDREVPWHDGAAIAAAWPGAALVTTEGIGHRKVLRDPRVVARVVDFLTTGGVSPASRFAPTDPLERELFDRESRWEKGISLAR
jgi:pimeloyl-ACP methyl ester carboxylesterase